MREAATRAAPAGRASGRRARPRRLPPILARIVASVSLPALHESEVISKPPRVRRPVKRPAGQAWGRAGGRRSGSLTSRRRGPCCAGGADEAEWGGEALARAEVLEETGPAVSLPAERPTAGTIAAVRERLPVRGRAGGHAARGGQVGWAVIAPGKHGPMSNQTRVTRGHSLDSQGDVDAHPPAGRRGPAGPIVTMRFRP